MQKNISDVDILDINNKILINFKTEEDKLPEYQERLKIIENSLELKNISLRVKESLLTTKDELIKHINDVENSVSLNFYTTETAFFLEKYKEILNSPLKVNFVGKPIKNKKEKNKIIIQYLEVAEKYVNIDIDTEDKDIVLNDKEKIVCNTCQNKKDFDIIDTNIYICSLCSTQQVILKNISSYKDNDRVNISSKYMYDRKIHFRDCVNQYQGKIPFGVFFYKLWIFLNRSYFFCIS